MKKIQLTFIAALLLLMILGYSCDKRGGTITGNGGTATAYNLDLSPFSTVTVPDKVVRIRCFVTDLTGEQVGEVVVNFESLDELGFITENMESSATDLIDGLNGTLYFDPKGAYGEASLVANVYSEAEDSIVIATDTAQVQIFPYTLEFGTTNLSLIQGSFASLYCRVINPLELTQTGGIHLEFSNLDMGSVSPTALSDDADPTGLQSPVIFTAPSDTTGIARIVANAVYGYTEPEIMGTDTLEITVVEN